MSEPLTNERHARTRLRLQQWKSRHVVEQMRDGSGFAEEFAEDVEMLLSEVERLRHIEEAARVYEDSKWPDVPKAYQRLVDALSVVNPAEEKK